MTRYYEEELRHRHEFFIANQMRKAEKEAERIGLKLDDLHREILLRSIYAALAHAEVNPIRLGNIH